jgi:hypothetical protein
LAAKTEGALWIFSIGGFPRRIVDCLEVFGSNAVSKRCIYISIILRFILLLVFFLWISSPLEAIVVPSSVTFAASVQQVVEIYNPAGVREDGVFVDKFLKKAMVESGKTRTPLAGDFPGVTVEKIPIKKDVFEEINDLFYKRGWTDGLPVVPPTKERVKEMLRGVDFSPDYLVAILSQWEDKPRWVRSR